MRSIKAHDRELEVWYGRIKQGELKLPRFQRHEAWDRKRIESLLNTVLQNLPLGVTLLLDVHQEQFESKYIATAEIADPDGVRVSEHLLDGQQRLTALWRSLHNNYEWETFFLYLERYDEKADLEVSETEAEDDEGDVIKLAYCQPRWKNKSGKRMPLWADSAKESLKRGCIPIHLLRPDTNEGEVDTWVKEATEHLKPPATDPAYGVKLEQFLEERKKLSDAIGHYREVVRHYNLPYLSLPPETPKDTALNVFINMNTNSKPLSIYDIIVAQIEGSDEVSLHRLQDELQNKYPALPHYFDLNYLILYTSALMQDKLPNRRGIWDMRKPEVIANWDRMENGLHRMVEFLAANRIYDATRLPTNAVLAVIAALFAKLPSAGDRSGQALVIIKRYLWSAFFTNRYDRAAATRAYADYMALSAHFANAGSNGPVKAPIFDRSAHPFATEQELLNAGWPKDRAIRARAVLAVANYFGAEDFADGNQLTRNNISDRHYHHVFPDALIREAEEAGTDIPTSWLALNCALITDMTNYTIGRKDPLKYLKDRYNWTNERVIDQRLTSHLIPVNELAAGDYEGLNERTKADKVKRDYEAFLNRRARLIITAARKLADGEQVSAPEVIAAVDAQPV